MAKKKSADANNTASAPGGAMDVGNAATSGSSTPPPRRRTTKSTSTTRARSSRTSSAAAAAARAVATGATGEAPLSSPDGTSITVTAPGAGTGNGNGMPHPEPSYQEIAEAAYHRYLSRGGNHGADFDDWIEAERQLRGLGESRLPAPNGEPTPS